VDGFNVNATDVAVCDGSVTTSNGPPATLFRRSYAQMPFGSDAVAHFSTTGIDVAPSFDGNANPVDGISTGGPFVDVTVTETGVEAIPFATTTRELGPVSIPAGSVKFADDTALGATDMAVMPAVRA
jgi:hypothetical protein